MPTTKNINNTAAVLEKIAAFKDEYKPLAKRMHQIIMEAAPELCPRVWYGMPGYAKSASTPVLIYFRADRYMTFGMTESAPHSVDPDTGHKLMATAWFFDKLDEATEDKVREIVKGALR